MKKLILTVPQEKVETHFPSEVDNRWGKLMFELMKFEQQGASILIGRNNVSYTFKAVNGFVKRESKIAAVIDAIKELSA